VKARRHGEKSNERCLTRAGRDSNPHETSPPADCGVGDLLEWPVPEIESEWIDAPLQGSIGKDACNASVASIAMDGGCRWHARRPTEAADETLGDQSEDFGGRRDRLARLNHMNRFCNVA
jgi:hypothetical protein